MEHPIAKKSKAQLHACRHAQARAAVPAGHSWPQAALSTLASRGTEQRLNQHINRARTIKAAPLGSPVLTLTLAASVLTQQQAQHSPLRRCRPPTTWRPLRHAFTQLKWLHKRPLAFA